MKNSTLCVILILSIMTAPSFKVNAQWLTTGNALVGSGMLGSTNNTPYTLISNNTQRMRITGGGTVQFGTSAVMNTTPLNYAQFDADGDLRFFGTGNYLIPSNAYAFRWEGDEDVGLFFSALNSRFEFRNNAASAVFHVSSSGDVHASGDLNIDGDINMDQDASIIIGTPGFAGSGRVNIIPVHDATFPTGGMLVLGDEAGSNLALDNNEILSRYAGVPQVLFIQMEGGNTYLSAEDGNGATLSVIDDGHVGIRTEFPERELEIQHKSSSGALYGLMISNEEQNHQNWTLYTNNSDGDLSFYQNGLFAGEFSDFDGIYTPSDARLKNNVKNMTTVLDRIMKLEPKTFNYTMSENPDKTHIGFIAQDMEKQFPEIVGRAGEEQDTYVMNYSMLGVLTVKAIQEQQQMIEDQKSEIDALKKEMETLKILLEQQGTISSPSEKSSSYEDKNILYQNQPNPFSDVTTISVRLKPEASNAMISISSMQGEMVTTIPVVGQGDVEVNAGPLPSGSYLYSLIVNGKVIDVKKMIVLD